MNNVINTVCLNNAYAAEAEAVEMSQAESCAVLIEEFSAIKEVKAGTYNRLHSIVLSSGSFENASTLLSDAEMIYIRSNFSEEQILAETTKGGKIKTTKFLPNDYRSAKSVLLNALENGVALIDENGDPLGKSALSAELSGSKKTPQMKLDEALQRALKLAREIHGDSIVNVSVFLEDGTIFFQTTA
jgi:hypothetical protein